MKTILLGVYFSIFFLSSVVAQIKSDVFDGNTYRTDPFSGDNSKTDNRMYLMFSSNKVFKLTTSKECGPVDEIIKTSFDQTAAYMAEDSASVFTFIGIRNGVEYEYQCKAILSGELLQVEMTTTWYKPMDHSIATSSTQRFYFRECQDF